MEVQSKPSGINGVTINSDTVAEFLDRQKTKTIEKIRQEEQRGGPKYNKVYARRYFRKTDGENSPVIQLTKEQILIENLKEHYEEKAENLRHYKGTQQRLKAIILAMCLPEFQTVNDLGMRIKELSGVEIHNNVVSGQVASIAKRHYNRDITALIERKKGDKGYEYRLNPMAVQLTLDHLFSLTKKPQNQSETRRDAILKVPELRDLFDKFAAQAGAATKKVPPKKLPEKVNNKSGEQPQPPSQPKSQAQQTVPQDINININFRVTFGWDGL